MSNINDLIEKLISSTEGGKLNWLIEKAFECPYVVEYYLDQNDEFIYADVNGNKICLVKHGGANETVNVVLFPQSLLDRPAIVIGENDIEKSHRLWTLYKLGERNATGADRIIDDIISTLSDDFPF